MADIEKQNSLIPLSQAVETIKNSYPTGPIRSPKRYESHSVGSVFLHW